MMSKDQADIIKMVYARFMENEIEDWSRIDEILEMLESLSKKELVQETEVLYFAHIKNGLRCTHDHEIQYCFAPYILEAVEIILELYAKTKTLHIKNAYILQYYLAMCELRLIYPV